MESENKMINRYVGDDISKEIPTEQRPDVAREVEENVGNVLSVRGVLKQ